MFQYVRQTENRWLGKTYVLRLTDGHDAYAMDISNLTSEQNADLQERYYHQLAIHHESVVKSDGILKLDESQKSNFPANIGHLFFVELIDPSRKNRTRGKIPNSLFFKLLYFKKLVSIFRELFSQDISHGDMFEGCLELFQSEDSIPHISISGFGRNSGDIVQADHIIGQNTFSIKHKLQRAYERDIHFLSQYFLKIFHMEPNVGTTSFESDIVHFCNSLQQHQFTIFEFDDQIQNLLQKYKDQVTRDKEQGKNSTTITASNSNDSETSPKHVSLTNETYKEKTPDKVPKPRVRKSQIFSSRKAKIESQFTIDKQKFTRTFTPKEPSTRSDNGKKHVLLKRRSNSFASKQAMQFVKKLQDIPSRTTAIQNEENTNKEFEDVLNNDMFSSTIPEDFFTKEPKETVEKIDVEKIDVEKIDVEKIVPNRTNSDDIYSQTIPFEELQSSPSISFRENNTYTSSSNQTEVPKDQFFVEQEILEETSSHRDNSHRDNIEFVSSQKTSQQDVPFQPYQKSNEEIMSEQSELDEEQPHPKKQGLSTEKRYTSGNTNLASDFFFSSIMDKLQQKESRPPFTQSTLDPKKFREKQDVTTEKQEEFVATNLFFQDDVQNMTIEDIPFLPPSETSVPKNISDIHSIEGLTPQQDMSVNTTNTDPFSSVANSFLTKNEDPTVVPESHFFEKEHKPEKEQKKSLSNPFFSSNDNPFLSTPPQSSKEQLIEKPGVFEGFTNSENIPTFLDSDTSQQNISEESFFSKNDSDSRISKKDVSTDNFNPPAQNFLQQMPGSQENVGKEIPSTSSTEDPFGFFQTDKPSKKLSDAKTQLEKNEPKLNAVQNIKLEEKPKQIVTPKTTVPKESAPSSNSNRNDLWFQEQKHNAYLQGMNVNSFGTYSMEDETMEISSSSSHKKIAIGVGIAILVLLYFFVFSSTEEPPIVENSIPEKTDVTEVEEAKNDIPSTEIPSPENIIEEPEKSEDSEKQEIKDNQDPKQETSTAQPPEKKKEKKVKKSSSRSSSSSYKKDQERKARREREKRKQREQEEREQQEREQQEREQQEREQQEREQQEEATSSSVGKDNPWLQESDEEETKEDNLGPVGNVRRKGDKVKILLKNGSSEVGIGSVAVGAYEVLVKFSGSKNYKNVGSLTVQEGGSYKITCNNMSRYCVIK
jgi:hypothetical protein